MNFTLFSQPERINNLFLSGRDERRAAKPIWANIMFYLLGHSAVQCIYAKHTTIPRYLKFNIFCLISTSDLKLVFS